VGEERLIVFVTSLLVLVSLIVENGLQPRKEFGFVSQKSVSPTPGVIVPFLLVWVKNRFAEETENPDQHLPIGIYL
jgi:hypothetical protein